jgi:HNH endonuclease
VSRHDLGRAGKNNFFMGQPQSDEEFILSRVEVVLNTRCWEWLGSISNDGYGKCKRNKITYRAHRLSFEIFRGVIKPGLFICHHCDNPICVNPEHLFAATHLENELDKDRKGRRSPSPSLSHPHLMIRGEQHHRAKLSELQAEAAYIYKLEHPLKSAKTIVDDLDLTCSSSTLLSCLKGQTWQHLNLASKYGKIVQPSGFEYINKLGLCKGRPSKNASGFNPRNVLKPAPEIITAQLLPATVRPVGPLEA